MSFSVFVTRAVPEAGILRLQEACKTVDVFEHDRAIKRDELLAMCRGRDGLLTMLSESIDGELLDACPSIRAVSNYAVGFNNIDVAECTRRRIGVSNTPGVLTDATAETAWLLLFAAARRAVEGEQLVRSGHWAGWGPMQCLGAGISGKTLGIIGAGRIGQRVAEMSRGFAMRVIYYNRNPKPEFEAATGATRVSLETLLMESDFISIHCALTPATRHLIGAPQIAMMKSTAVLVNTARGPIVDEASLVETLRSKRIFAAGLDVYENEPALADGLRELPNVVLMPHIGSATIETRTKMSVMAADNLVAMLRGRKPPHPVNPEVWDH